MEKIKTLNKLRLTRQLQQLTQEELGKIIGVNQRLISDWEREIHKPSLETKQKLAKALGCPLFMLFPGG